MKTFKSDHSARAHKFPAAFLAGLLPAFLLLFSIQTTQAGSAIWNLNPTRCDWDTAANWTPPPVPNLTSGTATLGTATTTVVSGLLTPGAIGSAPQKTERVTSTEAVPEGLKASDWARIQAAWQAHRHEVVPVGKGYRARNPGQQWRIQFDERGFLAQPESGAWNWGLELKSYGFVGQQKREVDSTAPTKAVGNRVAYERATGFWEWMVNDERGLEHGFTIGERPAGRKAGGELQVELSVRGGLRPQVSSDGEGIAFVDSAGTPVVTYAGLKVWDAEGRMLKAHFAGSMAGERVALRVDEREARYPITIDPLAQQAYLKASNTGGFDFFGSSVAISGDTVVVGGSGEASNATGVNGNQIDNSAPFSGAAYVFVRSGTTWTQQAYLKASNTDAGDQFGHSIAISGDTVVVGVEREDSSATGVNGNQSDNSAMDAGAAYVFVRSGTTWTQQAYLKASNTDPDDRFGFSVTISGDTVVVGANNEDSNATGVNGSQSDNSALFSGAAYVFVRSGTIWTQQAYLKASNTDPFDSFGSVAISGDTVVVGGYGEASNAIGINGNQADNSAPSSGAAYLFVRNGTIWTQQAYLKASNTDPDDFFGISVATSGDAVVVGGYGEASNATGINGNQADNSAPSSGAAYVFVRSGTIWTQQAYLKASNTDANDFFGLSVAISGGTAVVGALYEASNATGINGNQSDNSAPFSGAAYVFVRSGTIWTQQAYLKASNTDVGDTSGFPVAISGDTVVVGASTEDSNATGINGDQSDNSATSAGAAYIFTGLGPALPPVIISPSNATAILGSPFSFQIVATNSPTSFEATNLPAGLTVNSTLGIISGVPTIAGPKTVALTATNAAGSGTASLTLSVVLGSKENIVFINDGPETARTDQPFSFQIFATGISSDATFSAESLPGGLTIDPETGVISGSPTEEGSFSVMITITEGESISSFTLQLTFSADPGYPVIVSPGSVSLMAGEPFTYTIVAPVTGVDEDDLTVFIVIGELPPGLTFDSATGTISGTYTPSTKRAIKAPSGDSGSVPSKSVVASVLLVASNSHGIAVKNLLFLEAVPQLQNISTRMQVLTGDKVLIGGFIVTGNAPKRVILRAIGPALVAFGLADALADPMLELHMPDMTVVTNDNWKENQQAEIEATGLQPSEDLESAIVATLAPGAYTAIVSGKNGGTGVGLVEAYDLDEAADSTLANISTRGFVDTGDNVMIGGVIIGGGSSQVLVRAIGPALTLFGVAGALQDTILELHDKDGVLITSNDDWKETQQTAIEATGLAPSDDRESAILATLTPDSYTAIVRGKDDTTGVALVEVYNVSP